MAAFWVPRLDIKAQTCASGIPGASFTPGASDSGGGTVSDGSGVSVGVSVLISFFGSAVKKRRRSLCRLPLVLRPVFLCLAFCCLVFFCLVFSGRAGVVASFFSSRVVLLTFFFLLYLFLSGQALDDLVEKDAKIAEVCVFVCGVCVIL